MRLQADFERVTLSPLRKMDREPAERYLLGLPRVGVKTARCVLKYALGHQVMPLDRHCERVLRRLGFLPHNLRVAGVHDVAEGLFRPRHFLARDHRLESSVKRPGGLLLGKMIWGGVSRPVPLTIGDSDETIKNIQGGSIL